MTPQDLLADSVLATKVLLARYLVGFDEESRIRQAPNLPNHVAWNLGHLALTMHRIAEKIDGRALPEADISAVPPSGSSPTAFFAESVAFGSRPQDDVAAYPTLERSVQIYNNACDRLAGAVRATTTEDLQRVVPWGATGMQAPLWSLVARMIFHNGFHTGQIADLRRALGFKSIFA
jgi:hypothetical protein